MWAIRTPATDAALAAAKASSGATSSHVPASAAPVVLLGLVLVNLDASVEWQDMNQRDVIPKALRHRYQHTSFLRLGRCAQYEHVAPQYAQAPLPGPLGRRHAVFLDMEQVSCLNGWTMGNIATSALKDLDLDLEE